MAAVQVYYQESKEETRTETRNSGPNPTSPPGKSNELDSLLSELNSTSKYSAQDNNRSNQSSLPRPSVDSLLNELNSVSNGSSRITQNNHVNHTQQHSTTSNQATPITASTATRDLDDLMAELSDFKVKEVSIHPAPPPPPSPAASKMLYNSTYKTTTTTTSSSSSNNIHNNNNNIHSNTNISSINTNGNNIHTNTNNNTNTNGNSISTTIIDVHNSSVKPTQNDKLRSPALVRKLLNRNDTYAKPEKAKSPSPPQPIIRQVQIPQQQAAPPPPPQVVQQKEPTPPKSNELDSMLGSLASHMTEQGVTTTQKGACCACDKPIVGQVITALGKTWHPEHFTCAHCSHELGSKNFFERDGRPYCEACYHELFSPRCAYCNQSILDKCVTALDKNWHPEHFFCAQCGNTFGEEGFHEKDGKAYCREDYFNMFAPKCGGCNSPIMENYISALNTQWHPECFVCRDCRQPFNGGSFFDHEGMPYCETHYHAKRGSLCAGCHKPITGRCITAMFRKYHPEHFTCSFCLRQLNKGTFKEQNEKPYCHGCFDKLFS